MKPIALFLFLFFSLSLFCQDRLTLKEGQIVEGEILSETPTSIRIQLQPDANGLIKIIFVPKEQIALVEKGVTTPAEAPPDSTVTAPPIPFDYQQEQWTEIQKKKLPNVWLSANTSQGLYVDRPVILWEIQDDALLIPTNPQYFGRYVYFNPEDMLKVKAVDINRIVARKGMKPGYSAAVGWVSGMVAGGVIAGVATNDSEPDNIVTAFGEGVEAGAQILGGMIIGALVGGGIGYGIGAAKARFEINGNPEEFLKVTKSLNRYKAR